MVVVVVVVVAVVVAVAVAVAIATVVVVKTSGRVVAILQLGSCSAEVDRASGVGSVLSRWWPRC